jgi:DNA-directed RNA polymerase specialized sigma24 family protein
MREKRANQADRPAAWDASRIRAAQAAASCHAARFARQRRLSRADREDLVQDILLAILEASPRFDATRGAWPTFVTMLARRAVIDRARQPRQPELLSLAGPSGAAILPRLAAPEIDRDLLLGFDRALEELPPAPRELLRVIITHRDVADARDAHAASPATFYRELHDLRCWLRTLGARPATPAMRAAATSRPSGS